MYEEYKYHKYEGNFNDRTPGIIQTAQDTSVIVKMAKYLCNIKTPTELMSDTEIKRVCRTIGVAAPDTRIDINSLEGNQDPIQFGEIGNQLMISITLLEFPEYFEQAELIMLFRN